MSEGGSILVTAENMPLRATHGLPLKPGRYLKISIRDQGTGIPEDQISRIFDPYFTTKQGGSGLGLATAYSIIKRHDGHIAVESRLGVGSTFHIYLPASEKGIPEPEIRTARLEKGHGRVLLMDDDELVRNVAGQILEHLGYAVELARDGSEAIDLYWKAKEAGFPFDAVIMDMTIPGGMGGKDAIKKLREIDPHVKAIVSSGYSNDPIMSSFKEHGFKGIAPKPYKMEELSTILSKITKSST
jgi:CheY-like chemotaxis protein